MDRGLVLGGSVAGLLAARVLTDHADEVVIVERDDLAGGAATRRGVPQGTQVHGLLARGLGQIEALFPGLPRSCSTTGPRSPTRASTFIGMSTDGRSRRRGSAKVSRVPGPSSSGTSTAGDGAERRPSGWDMPRAHDGRRAGRGCHLVRRRAGR